MSPPRLAVDNTRSFDGKPPPSAMTAEISIIAACIIDPSQVAKAAAVLSRDHFYSEAHALIWEAIVKVTEAGGEADVVSVAEYLKAAGRLPQAGGMVYLVEAMASVPSVTNVETYVRAVYDAWRVRKALGVVQLFQATAYLGYENAQDLLCSLHADVGACADMGRGFEIEDNIETLRKIVLAIRATGDKPTIVGIPTGCEPYDRLSAGLHGTETTVVGARPGVGKSALLGQWALSIAKQDVGVGFISLEMPRMDLVKRMICADAHIDSMRLRRGGVSQTEWSAIMSACQELGKIPLWVHDTNGGISIRKVREMVFGMLDLAKKNGRTLGVVFLDFLQHLVRAPGEERMTDQQYLGIASRTLSDTAKELRLPIVYAVALNRNVESRSGTVRFPRMSDIRACGNIESDANNIVFLHRDAKVDENGRELSDQSGKTFMILAKQRNGPADKTIILNFIGAESRFRAPPGINDHLFDQ